MTGRTPGGDLRDRLVRALGRAVYRDDDPPLHVLRICEPWADALMPVIEAEPADLRVQLDHLHEIAAACSRRAQQAEERAYAAERTVCICVKGRSPADYDGPQRDCPIHGETAHWRQRAEKAEAERDAANNIGRSAIEQRDHWRQRAQKAEAALKRVRDLCNLTIAASCRVQAIDQARDTLAVIDLKEAR